MEKEDPDRVSFNHAGLGQMLSLAGQGLGQPIKFTNKQHTAKCEVGK